MDKTFKVVRITPTGNGPKDFVKEVTFIGKYFELLKYLEKILNGKSFISSQPLMQSNIAGAMTVINGSILAIEYL